MDEDTDRAIKVVMSHLMFVLNSFVAGERGHVAVMDEDVISSLEMLPEIANALKVIIKANLEEMDSDV